MKKNTIRRRIIAILIFLALAISLLPTALAVYETDEANEYVPTGEYTNINDEYNEVNNEYTQSGTYQYNYEDDNNYVEPDEYEDINSLYLELYEFDSAVLTSGVTVVTDEDSPTGYTAIFVHYAPTADRVELGGDFMLRDMYDLANTVQYYPNQFRSGLFPTGGGGGGRNYRADMEYVEDGYWMHSVPLTGGGIAYWLFVDGVRIGDPANPPPRSPTSIRTGNNDELSVVHMPWDSARQHALNNRPLELPFDGSRGTVQYSYYPTSYETLAVPMMGQPAGGPAYLMIYLPPGFNPNRATPYPVVYMFHGIFGDQTDWMGAGGAPNIMDNLIGEGVIEPTVVVSMNKHRHGFNFHTGAAGAPARALSDLTTYVMPFIEENFNVSDNPENRAVAGLSMGAALAFGAYLHNTADFGYFGFFSPPTGLANAAAAGTNLSELPNRDVPMLFNGYGMFATGYDGLPNMLTDADIDFAHYVVPGHHDMNTWAQLFAIFARDYLWQTEGPEPPGPRGVTVVADEDSPTGYTAHFVYHNPEAVLVEFVGLLNLRYIDGGPTVRSPHEFEPGWFHAPGAGGNYIVRMNNIGNGYWTASAPVAGGTINYWYQLYTLETLTVPVEDIPEEIEAPFRNANSQRITDPYNCLSNFIASPTPLPEGVGNFRYSLIHVPFDSANQHVLNNRDLEMRRTNQRGTLLFEPYYVNGVQHFMGIYLPYGYDSNREEPFHVIYTAHGLSGDLTDWLWQISAPNTLDNLIAAGDLPPTVIVTTSQPNFGFDGIPFGQPRPVIVNNLIDNVIPHVETNFNVSTNPEERAFVGLSMGTSVVAHMYYEHTTDFGYFAFLSGGHVPQFDFANLSNWNWPTLFTGHGLFEGGSNTQFPAWAESADIPYLYIVPSGYGAHLFSIFARDYLWQTERTAPGPRGVTVVADEDSPTGFTAHFVYHNPDATLVELAGHFGLRNADNLADTTLHSPEDFVRGFFPASPDYHRRMTYYGNGYWVASIPLTGGGIPYWLRVYTIPANEIPAEITGPFRTANSLRVYDPYNRPPQLPTTDVGPNRITRNEPYSVALVPWSELQDVRNNRDRELPRANPAERGTVQIVPFPANLGESDWGTRYLAIYLPPGFDPDRARQFPVIYVTHGMGGDQTDWMWVGGVPNIMDNLIAEGYIEPSVVVSMNQYHFGGWGGGFFDAAMLGPIESQMYNIMPFVEANFNVSDRPEDRAYIGLSFGGAMAVRVFAAHAGEFGHFGFLSTLNQPALSELLNGDIANRDFPSIFAGHGIFEAPIFTALPGQLTAAEIDHVFYSVPSNHDQNAWSQLFTIMARDYLWPPVPTVTFTPESVTISDANLSQSVTVSGTATGDIIVSYDGASVPTGVSVSYDATTGTVIITATRPTANVPPVVGEFVVYVTRQGVTESFVVTVNLTSTWTKPVQHEYRRIVIHYYLEGTGLLINDVQNNVAGREYISRVGTRFNLDHVLDRRTLTSDNEYVFEGWAVFVGGVYHSTYLPDLNRSRLHDWFYVPNVVSAASLDAGILALNDVTIVGETISLHAVWSIYEEETLPTPTPTPAPTPTPPGDKGLPRTGVESSVILWTILLMISLAAVTYSVLRIARNRKGKRAK